MQSAITQLLRNYCLICQLYLLKCVDVGDSPPTRLMCSRDPCRIQKRPRNKIYKSLQYVVVTD